MANPLQTAWSYLRGDDYHTNGAIAAASGGFATALRQATVLDGTMQSKFTPASSEVDWARVQSLVYTFSGQSGGGDFNSAVFACLMALGLGGIEPPLRMWRQVDINKREPVDHPLTSPPKGLLIRPNFFHRMRELLFWKTWCEHLDGNAYFLKIRSGDSVKGNVIELWPVSPTVIAPYTDPHSGNYIDGYKRWKSGNEWVIDPIENVIHFRLGLDDRDHRKGLAPIKRLVREIASDDAATRWTDRMLSIGGAASMMVTLPSDNTQTPEQIEEMRDRIEQRFTGERVGSVGVLSGGATANRYGFSPQEMDMGALHNVPETRICATIGVHPAVAMMSVGLSQTANFASLKEIYTAFTERKLAPMWIDDEETLNHSLLPDFASDPKLMIAHDLSEVRALQEDVNALWARVVNAFDKGLLTVDQALPLLGLEPIGGDIGNTRKGPAAVNPNATTGANATGSGTPSDNTPGGNSGNGTAGNANNATNAPAGNQPAKALEVKSVDDIVRWPELMDALVNLAEPSFTSDLQRYFDEQRVRTKHDFLAETAEVKFNPHHDPNSGRFTIGGPSARAVAAGGTADHAITASNPTGFLGTHNDTKELFQRDGAYTPERVTKVHDPYIREAIDHVPKSGGAPIVHVIGGGPASGKSSVKDNPKLGIPDKHHAVHTDADGAKAKIPEYNKMKSVGSTRAASVSHEESSDMAAKAVTRSLSEQRHTVVDAVMDSGLDKVKAKVANWRALGAKEIHASYVTVDPRTALNRAKKRAADPTSDSFGRVVPKAYIRGAHRDVAQVVPQLARQKVFDSLKLYDTDVPRGSPPKLLMSQDHHGMTIHDQSGWDAFVARGK